MNIILIVLCVIGIGATMFFAWALCCAAGRTDDLLDRLEEERREK